MSDNTSVKIVCISDTHNSQCPIPDGDVLIHAGDLTQSGTFTELQKTLHWLDSLPHRHKLVIAGNHDILLDPTQDRQQPERARERSQLDWGSITYLHNEAVTITCGDGRQLRVYGSPMTPKHGNWAFQYARGSQDVWSCTVPLDTDILITHGPPRAHLDVSNFGCAHLLRELWRVQPKLHVFGHVHDGYGTRHLWFDQAQTCYEQAVDRGGTVTELLKLILQLVRQLCGLEGKQLRPKTKLVNAAMVGGLLDEVKREATITML